jgi:prophage maintenance system killer protein
LSVILPPRSAITEIARRQVGVGDGPDGNIIDDKKLSAALAWPRLMVATDKNANLFDVGVSLLMGILTEQPLGKGNAYLAFSLLVITFRRNGVALDLGNEEAFQLLKKVTTDAVEEKSIAAFLHKKSVPQVL